MLVRFVGLVKPFGVDEPIPIPAKVVRATFFGFTDVVRVVVFGESAPKRVIAVALREMLTVLLHDDLHQLVALVVGQLHLAACFVV